MLDGVRGYEFRCERVSVVDGYRWWRGFHRNLVAVMSGYRGGMALMVYAFSKCTSCNEKVSWWTGFVVDEFRCGMVCVVYAFLKCTSFVMNGFRNERVSSLWFPLWNCFCGVRVFEMYEFHNERVSWWTGFVVKSVIVKWLW